MATDDEPSSLVFISYARRDLPFARQMSAALQARGFTSWLDVEHLVPGSDWAAVVDGALDGAAMVVVIASRSSVRSLECERECQRARRSSTRVVVAVIEALEVPPWLDDCPVIDLRAGSWPPWDEVAACIRGEPIMANKGAVGRWRLGPPVPGLALWLLAFGVAYLYLGAILLRDALAAFDGNTANLRGALVAAYVVLLIAFLVHFGRNVLGLLRRDSGGFWFLMWFAMEPWFLFFGHAAFIGVPESGMHFLAPIFASLAVVLLAPDLAAWLPSTRRRKVETQPSDAVWEAVVDDERALPQRPLRPGGGPARFAMHLSVQDTRVAREVVRDLEAVGHSCTDSSEDSAVDIVLLSNASDVRLLEVVERSSAPITIHVIVSNILIPQQRVAFHRRQWLDYRSQAPDTFSQLGRWMRAPQERLPELFAEDPVRLDRMTLPLGVAALATTMAATVVFISASVLGEALEPVYNSRALPIPSVDVVVGVAGAMIGAIASAAVCVRAITFGVFATLYAVMTVLLVPVVARSLDRSYSPSDRIANEGFPDAIWVMAILFVLGFAWAARPVRRWLLSCRLGRGIRGQVTLAPGSVRRVVASRTGAVVGAAAVAAVLTSSGNVVWPPDEATANLSHRLRVGAEPSAVALGVGAVWVANERDGTVSRIDPNRLKVIGKPIQVGGMPIAIAAGDGTVWVLDDTERTLSRIDPERHAVVGTPVRVSERASEMVVGEGSVWVANRLEGGVMRVDASSNRVLRKRIATGPTVALAVGHGAVWAGNRLDGRLNRIDVRKNRVSKRIEVAPLLVSVKDIAITRDAIWVAVAGLRGVFPARVVRVDPRTFKVRLVKSFEYVPEPQSLFAAKEAVWSIDEAGEITALNAPAYTWDDKAFGSSTDTIAAAAAGYGAIWAIDTERATLLRVDLPAGAR